MHSAIVRALCAFLFLLVAGAKASTTILIPSPLTTNTAFEFEKTSPVQFYAIDLVEGQGVTVVLNALNVVGGSEFQIFSPNDLNNFYLRSTTINSSVGVTSESFTAASTGRYVIATTGSGIGQQSLAVYSAFFNAGITDQSRNYYGSLFTSRYLVTGEYNASAQHDYFRFETQSGQPVAIEYSISAAALTSSIRVLNKSRQLVTQLANLREGARGTLSFVPASSDVYFLELTNSPQRYNLIVTGALENSDTDQDGLADSVELFRGTSPLLADTNGDGISDFEHAQRGASGRFPASLSVSDLASADVLSRAVTIPYLNQRFHLKHAGGERFLKFNMRAGERFTLHLRALRNTRLSTFQPVVSLFHEFAPTVAIKSISLADQQTYAEDFVASITGTYYLKLTGNATHFDLGVYQGFSAPGVSDADRDFYGTFNTARYLTEGQHSFSNEDTFYRFEAVEGDFVAISYGPTMDVNNGRMVVEVYFEDKALSRLNFSTGIVSGQQRRIEFEAAASGLYYIKMRLQTSPLVTAPGSYWMQVSGVQPDRDSDGDGISNTAELQRGLSPFSYDTNGNGVSDYDSIMAGKIGVNQIEWLADDFANATSISTARTLPYFNKNLTLHINQAANFIKFDLAEGETVVVHVKALLDSNTMYYQLYDPTRYSSNQFGTRRSVRNGQTDQFEFTANVAGTYAINFEGHYGLVEFAVIKGFANPDVLDIDRTLFSQPALATYLTPGAFALTDNERYFRFEAKAGDNISINLEARINGGNLSYQLIAPEIRQPVVTVNGMADLEKRTLTYHAVTTGVHYLRLFSTSSYLFANGAIKLELKGVRPDLDDDSDGLSNTQEYARGTDPLRVDTNRNKISDYEMALSGRIGKFPVELTAQDVRNNLTLNSARPAQKHETFSYRHTGGERVFLFSAEAGQDLILSARALINRGNVRFNLYSPEQKRLTSDTVYSGATQNSTVRAIKAEQSGTYYLEVVSSYEGTIELNIMDGFTTPGVFDDMRSYFGNFETSRRLYSDRYFRAGEGVADHFRFELKDRDDVQITVSPVTATSNGTMNFSLHRVQNINTRIDYASVRNGASHTFVLNQAEPGLYYLVVWSNSAHGYYDISTRGIADPQFTVGGSLGNGQVATGRGFIERADLITREGKRARFTITPLPGYKVARRITGNCPAGRWLDDVTYETGYITADCKIEFALDRLVNDKKRLPLWMFLISNEEAPSASGSEGG